MTDTPIFADWHALVDTKVSNAFGPRTLSDKRHRACCEAEDIEEARGGSDGLGKRILPPIRIGAHGTAMVFFHSGNKRGRLTETMTKPTGGTHPSN